MLLYAHHDVQPPGTMDLWVTSPFEATERNSRLFGRGTADDKAGIAAHAAALQAWEGKPPVTVSVFIEGEEEIASPNISAFLENTKNCFAPMSLCWPIVPIGARQTCADDIAPGNHRLYR